VGAVVDITGQRFGNLTVLHLADISRKALWNVRCDCGMERTATGPELRFGHLRTCGTGCKYRRYWRRHGAAADHSQTREYRSWLAMRARCRNLQYGYRQRGITVCRRWQSFAKFLTDMGPMPVDGRRYTVERVRNGEGYRPGNCCWATYKVQGRNRRNNRLITYKRKTQSLAAWAEESGISYGALKLRLRLGWPVGVALRTPVPAPHRLGADGKFARGRGTVRQTYKAHREGSTP